MGIEDEKEPLNAEIGSILAGVELIAKPPYTSKCFRARAKSRTKLKGCIYGSSDNSCERPEPRKS